MAQIIDIEEYAASGKKIPTEIGTQYRVRVNHKTVVLTKKILPGKEILIAAGYEPQNSNLMAHFRGEDKPSHIGNEQNIDLAQDVQRFTRMATDAQFGM